MSRALLLALAACSTTDRRSTNESPPPAVAAAPTAAASVADADLSASCPPGKLIIDDAAAPILGTSAITIVDTGKTEVAAQLLIWHDAKRVPACADLGPNGWPSGPRYLRLSRALDDAASRTWAGGVGSSKTVPAVITIEQRDERVTTLCVRSPVTVESEWEGSKHRVIVVGAFTGENCGTRSW